MHVANSHGWHWISLLIQLLQGTSAEVPCVCTRTFILGSEGWGTCQLWRPSGYSRGTLGSSGVLWGLGSSPILWVWGLHSIAGKFHIRVFHQHVAKELPKVWSSPVNWNLHCRGVQHAQPFSATDFVSCAKARHIAPVCLFFFHGLQWEVGDCCSLRNHELWGIHLHDTGNPRLRSCSTLVLYLLSSYQHGGCKVHTVKHTPPCSFLILIRRTFKRSFVDQV